MYKTFRSLVILLAAISLVLPSLTQALTFAELEQFFNAAKTGKVLGTATGQSLVLTPAMRGTAYLPNTAGFQAIGNIRVEGHMTNWTRPSSYVGIWEMDSSLGIRVTAENHMQFLGFQNEVITVPLGAASEFRFVAQRNIQTSNYTLELWDNSGNYFKDEKASNSNALFNRAGPIYRMSIGSFYEQEGPSAQFAFLRVYTTNKPLGSLPPSPAIPTTPADLLDFEFEGSLADTGPGNINFSFYSGTATYANTSVAAPTINLSQLPMAISVGRPTVLDASSSFSNNGDNNLSFAWSQISGPGPGVWSNPALPNPTFTAPSFGLYKLQLTVTDAAGQSASKIFELGAVVTDANNVVTLADAKMSKALGPLIRLGANPWSWADDRNLKAADLLVNSLDTYWNTNWFDTPAAGTVAATVGSAAVTGAGTNFIGDVCTASEKKSIVLWYNSPDYPGTTGRAFYNVASCESDTQLTLGRTFGELASGGTGSITYGIVSGDIYSWIGYYGGRITASYYSNIAALYSLYYRSGQVKYLTTAQKLADRLWRMPAIDRGRVYWKYTQKRDLDLAFLEMRKIDTLGLLVRALEDPNMFLGLRHLWAYLDQTYNTANTRGQLSDHRELGFTLRALAMCAMLEPSTTEAAKCRTTLKDVASYSIGPLTDASSQGIYQTLSQYGASFGGAAGYGGGSSVKVVDGQTQVTAVTGNPGFTNAHSGSPIIWFLKPGITQPTNNSDGDSRAYAIAFPVVSNTQLNLTEPYKNPGCPPPSGCTVGWTIGTQQAGFGAQSYMVGIYAVGLDYARLALEEAGEAAAALYKTWLTKAGDYLTNHAYWPGTKGAYLGRGFVTCEPVGNNLPNGVLDYCRGTDTNTARANLGEIIPGLLRAYLATGREDFKQRADEYYTGIYGKPGTQVPLGQTTDIFYDSALEDSGYKMAATNGVWNSSESNKWLGFHFGVGNAAGWPAARLSSGGVVPPTDTTPPLLSSIVVTPAATTTNITWTTSEPADTQVEYGLTAGYGQATPLNAALSTNHAVTIHNLAANTIYHFRVKSKDAAANLAASADQTFTTTVVVVPPPLDTTPPNVAITSPSANATVSGNVTLSAAASDNIGISSVQILLDGVPYGSSDSVAPYESVLSTLSLANGTHTVSARATDFSGNTAVALTVSFAVANTPLPSDTAAPVISNIQIPTVSKNSATITWTTDELSDSQVEYGTTASLGKLTPVNTLLTIAHAVKISGLTRSTAYTFRVISKDASGNSAASNPITFTTSASGKPAKPTNVSVQTTAAGDVASVTALSWEPSVDADTTVVVKSSDAIVSTNPSIVDTAAVTNTPVATSSTTTSVSIMKVAETERTATLDSANAQKTYYLVYAIDEDGEYSEPVVVEASGLGTLPAGTYKVRLVNDNGTFFLITNGQKQGIANPGLLASYGLAFGDAEPATVADRNLPEGSLLLPAEGALVKSLADRTVYVVSKGQRYGFTSAAVFNALGYKFSSVLLVTNPELQALPKAQNLNSPTAAHLPGTDVAIDGTVYYIGADNTLHPYPTLSVYNSWHKDNDFSTVVSANSADRSLPKGEAVVERVIE